MRKDCKSMTGCVDRREQEARRRAEEDFLRLVGEERISLRDYPTAQGYAEEWWEERYLPDVDAEAWEFWKPVVCDDQGNLDVEKVKNELHDYGILLKQIPQVYDHVSGGMISNPFTLPFEVCNAADKHYEELHREEEE